MGGIGIGLPPIPTVLMGGIGIGLPPIPTVLMGGIGIGLPPIPDTLRRTDTLLKTTNKAKANAKEFFFTTSLRV